MRIAQRFIAGMTFRNKIRVPGGRRYGGAAISRATGTGGVGAVGGPAINRWAILDGPSGTRTPPGGAGRGVGGKHNPGRAALAAR